jgi:small subunit ribosomal protein S6
MALYETTMIFRPELATTDVEKVAGNFEDVIKSGGKTIKKEFWGLRDLSYKIHKSKKGHYVHFGYEANAETVSELRRKLGISEDVLRDLTVRVEKISKEPTDLE